MDERHHAENAELPRTGARRGPAPGDVFGGRYNLVELLGSGGAADVWRASDIRLGRMVAVKVLSSPVAADPMWRARMEREALALARMAHPAVVSIHDYGEEPVPGSPPLPYIVMELVDGPDMASYLAGRGALRPSEAIGMLLPILDAVEHAHSLGVVHGDLKPSNILLAGDRPKVGDFGVARMLGQQTGATIPLATPAYAAPEVLAHARPTPASDVFSLGCIAIEMLTGSRPFERNVDAGSALAGIPGLPREAAGGLSRAIDPDPSRRPRSAAALAEMVRPPDPAGDATATAPMTAVAGDASPAPATVRLHREATEALSPAPRRQRLRPAALRSIRPGIAIAAGAVLLILLSRLLSPALVGVPDVVGIQVGDARATLTQAGLGIRERSVDRGGRAGTVVDEHPRTGRVRRGAAIVLDVTKGAPQVLVPDVTGKPLDEAIGTLQAAGLVAGGDVAYVASQDVPARTVVRTIPAGGQSVDVGTGVQLIAAAEPAAADRDNRGKGKGRGRDKEGND
jgi:serine/threonine-protein kinase